MFQKSLNFHQDGAGYCHSTNNKKGETRSKIVVNIVVVLVCAEILTLRPDIMSSLVHKFACRTPTVYIAMIAPYGKINHGLVNRSYNCDVKLGLKVTRMKIV